MKKRSKKEIEARSRRLTPRRKSFSGGGSLGFAAAMLNSLAPTIEVAGSLDRALQAGIIGAEGAELAQLKAMVPISRGGSLDHPDADKDWEDLVARIVKSEDVDLDAIRAGLEALKSSQADEQQN